MNTFRMFLDFSRLWQDIVAGAQKQEKQAQQQALQAQQAMKFVPWPCRI
jgi:hypothetical protein